LRSRAAPEEREWRLDGGLARRLIRDGRRTPISWKEDTGGGDWEKPDKKDRTGIFVGFLVWWNSLFSCSPMEERVAKHRFDHSTIRIST
jgi:hypothetical protein